MSSALFGSADGASSGEPSLTASAVVAQTVGSHILRIDGYSRTKRRGNGKCFDSDTFFVGGHCWRMQYYPDGLDERYSGSISIFLRLDYPIYGVSEVIAKFRISLLDKNGNPVPSYTCNMEPHAFSIERGGHRAFGYEGLICHIDLERSDYLKEDVFSVRCDVTVPVREIVTKAIPVSAVCRGV
ncbi:hypothetical protein VPH35_125282 [Triticum aestivum]